MIELKQIESFYPETVRPFKLNLVREYFQYKILEIIFASPQGGQLVFMGGTALRVVLGLNRFSEDLDFDNRGLSREDFIGLSLLIAKRLGLEGYRVEIKNTVKGAYHAYVRFGDILFRLGLTGHKQARIMVRIDMEPQKYAYQPQMTLLNKFDIFFKMPVVPQEILLAQKIYAIFNRKRLMGRDFYDAVFLFGRTRPDGGYLKAKMNIGSKEELKQRLLARCQRLNFKALAKDVEPFLMNSSEAKKVILFREYVEGLEM